MRARVITFLDALSAIGISPEPSTWFESDFASDLKITGNTIQNVGFGWANKKNILNAGAIAIAAAGPAPAGGHRRIVIADNTIADAAGVNILVTSASDVTIRGNRFVRANQGRADAGSAGGIDGSTLVWISESDGVSLAGHTFADRGPLGRALVGITPSALNIKGVEEGVSPQDGKSSVTRN